MMKTLLVLRHAKSSWDNAYVSDHDRPLNKRGKADAPRMGQLIRNEQLTPDLIISSTAKRADTTAQEIAHSSGYEHEVSTTQRFYLADAKTYVDALQTADNRHDIIMVVGHNPGMGELVEMLTDRYEAMPTCALAQITLPIDHWRELSYTTRGELTNYWYPKGLS